jgi:predicted nucleic acid-binding protein
VSTSLVLEYEAVLKRDVQLIAAGLTSEDVDAIIDLTIQRARLVAPWFSWRPQLPDPKDESILALAIAAQAPIITFNEKDFRSAAQMFGVKVQSPKQLLGASSP